MKMMADAALPEPMPCPNPMIFTIRLFRLCLRDRKVSTSYIQRRLGIGYNRAASLIERMEQEGLIGAANHAGKREILVPDENETI